MGDRGNIIVKDGDSTVYLYTHWSGTDLPDIVKRGLAMKWRWDDGPYLARILFDQMTEGRHGEEVGFGISSTYGDGGTDITVDVDKQTVSRKGTVIAFADYIK